MEDKLLRLCSTKQGGKLTRSWKLKASNWKVEKLTY